MLRRSHAPAASFDGRLEQSSFQERGVLSPYQIFDGSPGQLQEQISVASSPIHAQETGPLGYKALQEYHSAYTDEQVEPAGASPGTPLHRITHSRQQSFTNLLPLSIRSKLSSPERNYSDNQQLQLDEEDMALTGEGRLKRTHSATPQGVGASEVTSTDTTLMKLTKSQSATADTMPKNNTVTPQAAAPSRFAMLVSSIISKNTQPEIDPASVDALLTLNVEEALFPGGSPSSKDTFSPAAFKNLQTNATGLLLRMQTALRQKHTALQEAEKDAEAKEDEQEEAKTRAIHLKLQLEDMAGKAIEQEMLMKQLVEDFAAEKKARAEERAMYTARDKTISVIQSDGSTVSEDLGVDDDQDRRAWRASNGTLRSDISFETDVDSVFSRPRSASRATSSFEGSVIDVPASQIKAASAPAAARPKTTQQMTTFQKLMKNISGDTANGGSGCQNCKGQEASIAWDTVGLLRDENRGLKLRVGELEDIVDDALDMVNGVGI